MKRKVSADIVIAGGGVAGLWLLNRLRQEKFSVILLEADVLGGGQTHKSQGIIHGGMKYAVTGFNKAANAIAGMPEVWKRCLAGEGAINLQDVPLLSPQQYLWSPQSFSGKIAGFMAGVAMRTEVNALTRENYPPIFQNPTFNGDVYSVSEMVIDVHALIRTLAKPNQDALFKIHPIREDSIHLDTRGRIDYLSIRTHEADPIQVHAQQFIFVAGSGNEILFKKLKNKTLATQRRPLHMVYVKIPHHYSLFAHCLNMSSTPRLTITTHLSKEGDTIWYLGGALAESGNSRTEHEQINAARTELNAVFPWLDFSKAEFSTCRIDRAEPFQEKGGRPDSHCIKTIENMIAAWPTKLALAPRLADDIVALIKGKGFVPEVFDTRELRACPMPPFAQPPWDSSMPATEELESIAV